MDNTIDEGELVANAGLQKSGFSPSLSSLFSFMMLPEGPIETISRLIGLIGFLTALEIYNHFGWIRAEYRVQSWWWGDTCLDLPANEPVATVIVVFCAIASMAMVFGYRGKIAPLTVVLSIAYVTTLDINLAYPHSYFLTMWVCIALLFRRSPESVSRSLIQLSLVACYGLSALQKFLTPEFISGHSLSALITETSVQRWFASIVQGFSLSPQSWQAISISVAIFELSLALALCFQKTRTAGVCGVVLFQTAIFLTMNQYIALLHFTIFVSCLAFFDSLPSLRFWIQQKVESKVSPSVQAERPGNLYFVCAALASVCLLSLPLRIYLIPGALERFTLLDRRPWTFCMYLTNEGQHKTTISLRRRNAAWEPIAPRGRMNSLASDAEMRALAHYIVKAAPPFEELRIESQYVVNLNHVDRKILTGKAVAPGRFEYHIAWSRTPVLK